MEMAADAKPGTDSFLPLSPRETPKIKRNHEYPCSGLNARWTIVQTGTPLKVLLTADVVLVVLIP